MNKHKLNSIKESSDSSIQFILNVIEDRTLISSKTFLSYIHKKIAEYSSNEHLFILSCLFKRNRKKTFVFGY